MLCIYVVQCTTVYNTNSLLVLCDTCKTVQDGKMWRIGIQSGLMDKTLCMFVLTLQLIPLLFVACPFILEVIYNVTLHYNVTLL